MVWVAQLTIYQLSTAVKLSQKITSEIYQGVINVALCKIRRVWVGHFKLFQVAQAIWWVAQAIWLGCTGYMVEN